MAAFNQACDHLDMVANIAINFSAVIDDLILF